MDTYTVEVFFQAEGRDGGGTFRRTLALPFVPVVGMGLVLTDLDDYGSNQIQAVAWDVAAGRFYCPLADDTALSDPWQDFKKYYLADGWELGDEWVRRGDVRVPVEFA